MILINKDCIEVMKEMEDDSINLLCDIPYENTKVEKDYKKEFSEIAKEFSEIAKEFSEIANELKRIIKKI